MVTVLWRSSHPGPTLVVTALSGALGAAAGLDAARLAVLAVAVLLGQLSIGLSNDVIDLRRDRAAGRLDKPLVTADVPVKIAWITAIVCGVAALGLSAVLSWPFAIAHTIMVAAGWAYNAALKSTVWSAACFVLAFAVFPSYGPLALPDPRIAPLWAWIAGATFGVAIHFANVLPDIDDDVRLGVRGLPHVIGRRASTVIAFAALLVGAAAGVFGPFLASDQPLNALSAAVGVMIVGITVWGVVSGLSRGPSRRSFRLVMLAALLLAVQLVIGGASLA